MCRGLDFGPLVFLFFSLPSYLSIFKEERERGKEVSEEKSSVRRGKERGKDGVRIQSGPYPTSNLSVSKARVHSKQQQRAEVCM